MSLLDPKEELTAEQLLASWDAGDIIWTIEMGGMGPGYEQCIHVLMFEILRHSIVLRNEVPNTDMDGIMDAALAFATPNVDPCPSGNQAWAARKLAHEALTGQWAAMLNKAGTDCCIMVSNMWPRVRP